MRNPAAALLCTMMLGCAHFGGADTPAESVRTRYDAGSGITSVRASVVYRNLTPPHTVDLLTQYEGRDRPEQIWDAILIFSTAQPMARGWHFRESNDLVFLLEEGEPIRYTGSYEGVEGASIVTETVRFRVTLEDLRRIAASPRVRGRLGTRDFEWRERETGVVAHFLTALLD